MYIYNDRLWLIWYLITSRASGNVHNIQVEYYLQLIYCNKWWQPVFLQTLFPSCMQTMHDTSFIHKGSAIVVYSESYKPKLTNPRSEPFVRSAWIPHKILPWLLITTIGDRVVRHPSLASNNPILLSRASEAGSPKNRLGSVISVKMSHVYYIQS